MTAEAKKKEALRLTAIGRAALDEGEVKTALTAARQAEALKVPESAYVAGELECGSFCSTRNQLLDAMASPLRILVARQTQTVGGTQAATGQDQRLAQMLFAGYTGEPTRSRSGASGYPVPGEVKDLQLRHINKA